MSVEGAMATDAAAKTVKGREERWREEASFFDGWAEKSDDEGLPIEAVTFRRYARAGLRRRFNKEFRFRLMGDLRGSAM